MFAARASPNSDSKTESRYVTGTLIFSAPESSFANLSSPVLRTSKNRPSQDALFNLQLLHHLPPKFP